MSKYDDKPVDVEIPITLINYAYSKSIMSDWWFRPSEKNIIFSQLG